MAADDLMVSPVEAPDEDILVKSEPTTSGSGSGSRAASAEASPAAAASSVDASSVDASPEAPAAPAVLPRVTSVVPATFVPLWDDLLGADGDNDDNDDDDDDDNADGREAPQLQTLARYRTGVRRGIRHLAALDRQRILAMAAADSEDDEIPGPDELDVLVAAVQARTETEGADGVGGTGGTGGMVGMVGMVGLDGAVPPQTLDGFPVRPGGRRDAVAQLSETLEQAVRQLAGYESHISSIQQRWADALPGGGEGEQRPADRNVAMAGT